MNPIVYALKPGDVIPFLLYGEMVCYIQNVKPPERQWHLNVYSSVKSRATGEKKLKRGKSDIIFIEWETSMEDIVNTGKLVFPLASDEILPADKLDIWNQLNRRRKRQ
jgi:hypothetical protein